MLPGIIGQQCFGNVDGLSIDLVGHVQRRSNPCGGHSTGFAFLAGSFPFPLLVVVVVGPLTHLDRQRLSLARTTSGRLFFAGAAGQNGRLGTPRRQGLQKGVAFLYEIGSRVLAFRSLEKARVKGNGASIGGRWSFLWFWR